MSFSGFFRGWKSAERRRRLFSGTTRAEENVSEDPKLYFKNSKKNFDLWQASLFPIVTSVTIASSFRVCPVRDRTLSIRSAERTEESITETVPTIRIISPQRTTPFSEYHAGPQDVPASSRDSFTSSEDSFTSSEESLSSSEDSDVTSSQHVPPNPQAMQTQHFPLNRRAFSDNIARSRPELFDDTFTSSQVPQRWISAPTPRRDIEYDSSNMAENYRNGSSTRPRAALDNYESYKIPTEFHEKYVVQYVRNSEGLLTKVTWEDEREIGRGAAGVVYCQRKRGTDTLRAVKSIHVPKEGLSQELSALVELRKYDQFFVRFLGWYLDGSSAFMYLITEYIRDGDLGTYIRSDTMLARRNAKDITAQILGGLQILHSKYIYHRDIKPQNILIARLDPIWVKIADFGVSKKAYNTTMKTNWGTECYRPPELSGVIGRKPGGMRFPFYALDIWPLGALLHELLTGRTPFLILDNNTGFTETVSGFVSEPYEQPRIDMSSFVRYCEGIIDLPIPILEECQVNVHGINFLKTLLNPNPNNRPTADMALRLLSSTKDNWMLSFPLRVPNLQRPNLCYNYNIHKDSVDSDLRSSRKVREKDSAESNFTYIIDKADTVPAVRSFETLDYSDGSSIHTPSSPVTPCSDPFASATFSSRIHKEGNRTIIDFCRV